MAYNSNTKYSGKSNRPAMGGAPAQSQQMGGEAVKSETLFRTGLFVTDGGKSLASVQVSETITIPAGSYINLFHNTDKKSESSPDYTISVRSGVLKKRA